MVRETEADLDQFKEATAEKLAAVRCPVHRQGPRLRFEGETLGEVKIQLSGCCGKLMTLANQAIAKS